jgi:hypothetical protein
MARGFYVAHKRISHKASIAFLVLVIAQATIRINACWRSRALARALKRHTFNAGRDRRNIAASSHETCRAQRQHAPSTFPCERSSKLFFADLARRVRMKNLNSKSKKIVAPAGKQRGSEFLCKALSLNWTEKVEETTIHYGAEWSWEL